LDPAVWVAIIVACSSLTGPLLLNAMNTRAARKAKSAEDIQRRLEKQEDYDRQDLVAARAEKAAKMLEDSQAAIVDAVSNTDGKLDAIHTLVNSHLTGALQAELGATEREVEKMRMVVTLKKQAGAEPSAGALAAIKSTEERIEELRQIIKERLEQTVIANHQSAGDQ
jgi:hypothetical protein